VDAELARIDKELAKAEGDLRSVEGKLGNANFVDRAPAEVVQQQRDRKHDLERTIDELASRRDALAALRG
jgi:valyl-tRNA synthetase